MVIDNTELIRIKKSVKDKLDKLGKKGDSYNDIIERLLN